MYLKLHLLYSIFFMNRGLGKKEKKTQDLVNPVLEEW